MNQARPAPLVPPEVDLRDFAFMPLDVARLRDSELAASESPEACWAAVLLWAASWHQVPAASVPNDDKWLAKAAGYGRVVKEWMRVKEGAMRGFVECSDGRLYHPVVAEKAADAWTGKLAQSWRTECARIKKHNQRHELTGADAVPLPDFDRWRAAGCPQGHPLHVPRDKADMSQGQAREVPRETPSNRQGEGQGQGQGDSKVEAPQAARRGSRLPADWAPGQSGLAFAAGLGLANGAATAELAKFRDHWAAKTGKDATKADWQAAWRNWCRRAVEMRPGAAPGRHSDALPFDSSEVR